MGMTETGVSINTASQSPLTASSTTHDLEPQLRRWATRMRAANLAETTIKERLRQVRTVARVLDCDPFAMSEDDIAWYLAQNHLGAGTRRTYCQSLRAWHLHLQRTHVRPDNPMLEIRAPRMADHQIRPIVDAHIERLLRIRMHARTRGMILCGAYAGMRACEIARVRTDDFDFDSNQVEILGKGGKVRYVDIHPQLGDYVRYVAPSHGWWFPFKGQQSWNKPVLPKGVGKVVGDAMVRAGVSGTCHSLRRWFATAMVERGEDISTVQVLLGHASVATTQKYVFVSRTRTAGAVARLPLLD